MAGVPVAAYEEFWLHEVNSLQSEYKDIIAEHPDAAQVMEQVHKVLGDIVCLAGCAPANVGMGDQWAAVVKSAEQDRRQLCNTLKGKLLFSALYGTYTVTLGNLKEVLQASASRKEQAAPAATSQEATRRVPGATPKKKEQLQYGYASAGQKEACAGASTD
jgi:hypothetical protein